jgi:hypothetical protein
MRNFLFFPLIFFLGQLFPFITLSLPSIKTTYNHCHFLGLSKNIYIILSSPNLNPTSFSYAHMISFAFALWSLHYAKPSKQGCTEISLNPPSTLTFRCRSLISAQPCSLSFTLYYTLHGACYLNIIPFNLFTSFCLVPMLMIWTWHIISPFPHHLQVEYT